MKPPIIPRTPDDNTDELTCKGFTVYEKDTAVSRVLAIHEPQRRLQSYPVYSMSFNDNGLKFFQYGLIIISLNTPGGLLLQ